MERRESNDRRGKDRRGDDRRDVDRRAWDRRSESDIANDLIQGTARDLGADQERRAAGRRQGERRASDRRGDQRRHGPRRELESIASLASTSHSSLDALGGGQSLEFRGPGGNKTMTEITSEERVPLRDLQANWTGTIEPLVQKFHHQVIDHFKKNITHVKLMRATIECLSKPNHFIGRKGDDVVEIRLCAVCLCTLKPLPEKEDLL